MAGFMHWLGRQVGHVRNAIKMDVTRQIVHQSKQVREAQLPPNVTLRRTVIDEVIVDANVVEAPPQPQSDQQP